jgi:hypothetical protein
LSENLRKKSGTWQKRVYIAFTLFFEKKILSKFFERVDEKNFIIEIFHELSTSTVEQIWNEISSHNEITSVYPRQAPPHQQNCMNILFETFFSIQFFSPFTTLSISIKESVCQLNLEKSIFNRFKIWNSIIQFLLPYIAHYAFAYEYEMKREKKSPRHLIHPIKSSEWRVFLKEFRIYVSDEKMRRKLSRSKNVRWPAGRMRKHSIASLNSFWLV